MGFAWITCIHRKKGYEVLLIVILDIFKQIIETGFWNVYNNQDLWNTLLISIKYTIIDSYFILILIFTTWAIYKSDYIEIRNKLTDLWNHILTFSSKTEKRGKQILNYIILNRKYIVGTLIFLFIIMVLKLLIKSIFLLDLGLYD